MKLIQLTQGKFAKVDDADFESLSVFKWYAFQSRRRFYAQRKIRSGGKAITVQMHRQLLGLRPGEAVKGDHENGDSLDNQRHNLRRATSLNNSRNSGKVLRPTSSRFKGVCWDKRQGQWVSRIRPEPGKRRQIGFFDDETEAALAYDTAARQYHGPFARLNFPENKNLTTVGTPVGCPTI